MTITSQAALSPESDSVFEDACDEASMPESAKSADAFRTIGEAAAELGLKTHVLRFWETKFDNLRPMKRPDGRRFYRADDMELLRKTNNGRDINRHYYSTAEIDENLKRPVVKALNALAKFRNELDAFDGTFSYTTDDDTSISFTWRGETSQATLTFEPKRGLGVDNTTPVAMLEWEDSAGDHRSDDLIANPPVVA